MTSASPQYVRDQIAVNLDAIRSRIAAAANRSGRSADDVTLVAVTKYAEPEWVHALVELGVTDLGESRPQQLAVRTEWFESGINWHLIGQLQRNKVRPMLPVCSLIHSVESFRLLDRINRLAEELKLRPRVLLEVNVSGEDSKSGFTETELADGWQQIDDASHVNVDGFMTMAPRTNSPDETRPVFRRLRELRDSLRTDSHPLDQLSMGMSNDFEIAVEEEATFVRVGSSLFEGLTRP